MVAGLEAGFEEAEDVVGDEDDILLGIGFGSGGGGVGGAAAQAAELKIAPPDMELEWWTKTKLYE